jgi:post-segregation antitoxin (ccd killing protein)
MVTVDSSRLAAMRQKGFSISEATDLGMAAMLAKE